MYISALQETSQDEGIDPDDIRLAIETIQNMRKRNKSKGGNIIDYLTKEQLYRKVQGIHQMLEKSGIFPPFTIEKICERFQNILIEYVPLKTRGLRGIVALATEDEPDNCILIDAFLSKEEQYFHSMHEFMHISLHQNADSKTFQCYDRVRPNQNEALEWQANEGAGELIMPYRQFIPLFSKLFTEYSNLDKSDYWKSNIWLC